MNKGKLHVLLQILLALFLITFLGGGLFLFINLFIPFLSEAAFCIIALIIMAELLPLLIVGRCLQVVSVLRALRENIPPITQVASDDRDPSAK